MADDSSDNAFSFAGHAAAPTAGTQLNSSQSIDTGGSDNSELGTQLPRRALFAPGGRLPSIPAIEDTDSVSRKRRTSDRQSSPPTTPRTKAKPISSDPPSPIQEAYSIRDWIVPEDFQPWWQRSLHCLPGQADRVQSFAGQGHQGRIRISS